MAERYRNDRLGQIAASLTYTTLLALVPFLTVVLAIFAAFPIFSEMQQVLQNWLTQSLFPENISRPVMDYLMQFAAQASRLGAVGFFFLIVTALALILTIDRTLNTIWRVPHLRPLGQRVLIYWAAMTLGPLVLAGGLMLTTSAASAASHHIGGALPGGVRLLFGIIEFLVMAAGMSALYHYVPNTTVRWRHALAGGVFVALCVALAKKGLAIYLASVPTYSLIYGAFATVPLLLLWVYMVWVIVLLGAVIAAYVPRLRARMARTDTLENQVPFALAVQVLQQLHAALQRPHRGLSSAQLARWLHVGEPQLAPVLQELLELGWVAQINEVAGGARDLSDARYLLLAEPASTPMEPLVQRLLIERTPALQRFWGHTGMQVLKLADVLEREPAGGAPAPAS
nr:YihY family inner membrane protein [Comamonas sp. NLF-1-9]